MNIFCILFILLSVITNAQYTETVQCTNTIIVQSSSYSLVKITSDSLIDCVTYNVNPSNNRYECSFLTCNAGIEILVKPSIYNKNCTDINNYYTISYVTEDAVDKCHNDFVIVGIITSILLLIVWLICTCVCACLCLSNNSTD